MYKNPASNTTAWSEAAEKGPVWCIKDSNSQEMRHAHSFHTQATLVVTKFENQQKQKKKQKKRRMKRAPLRGARRSYLN